MNNEGEHAVPETPVALPPPYQHNAKDEPRQYWRVDRALSRLTGVVHYYGHPTSTVYHSIEQLMQDYTPTVEDRCWFENRQRQPLPKRVTEACAAMGTSKVIVKPEHRTRRTASKPVPAKAEPVKPMRNARPEPVKAAAIKVGKKIVKRREPPRKFKHRGE